MWHSFKPKNAEWYRWRLNGAAAYLRRDREAWRAAFKTVPFHCRGGDFGGPEAACPPEDLPVTRAWGAGESVFLHPYLSPLPYVLRPRERLRIAPGRSCRFAVALPPLLRFELAPERVLAEEMPFTVSRTFVGPNLMHGEICHSLSLVFEHCAPRHDDVPDDDDRAARRGTGEAPSALIHCDITVVNSTKSMLEPESLTIHPEPLSVYVHRDRLVTDALALDFVDGECRPRVERTVAPGHRLVSAGVKYRAGESFARRSVDIIKDITSI